MREFPKIEDFFLNDAEERAIPPEVEQKIIKEMYELSIQRAREEFEAHEEAKKILIF
jgi:hypothetical protein